MNITNDTMYNIYDKPMTCFYIEENKYVVRSPPFMFGPVTFIEYTCLDIQNKSDSLLIYHHLTEINPGQENKRVVVNVEDTLPTMEDVCNNLEEPAPGTFSVMVKPETINESVAMCPNAIRGVYDVTVDGCPEGALLDVCTDKTQLDYNFTTCNAGYSGEVVYDCLYEVHHGGFVWLSLYNGKEDPATSAYAPFSCMVMEQTGDNVLLTHAPGSCEKDQTPISTASGAAQDLDTISSCQDTTPAPPTTEPTETTTGSGATGTVTTASGMATADSNITGISTTASVPPVVDGSTTTIGTSAASRFVAMWSMFIMIALTGRKI